MTGLVLGDVAGALAMLQNEISCKQNSKWREVCADLADFLMKQDEYHGIISNHLATSALGTVRWGLLAKEENPWAFE